MSSHKVPLTFTFHQGGLRPPLFVAGTFSDPPWQPEEMEASTDEHGEFTFTKKIMVNESSEIQYKYLSASGDWWLTDPNADTGEMLFVESWNKFRGFYCMLTFNSHGRTRQRKQYNSRSDPKHRSRDETRTRSTLEQGAG